MTPLAVLTLHADVRKLHGHVVAWMARTPIVLQTVYSGDPQKDNPNFVIFHFLFQLILHYDDVYDLFP